MESIKTWVVEYDHKDVRHGQVKVETEVTDSRANRYGNGKCGCLTVGGETTVYDLRYTKGEDLHKVMIEQFFGSGLVKATEA